MQPYRVHKVGEVSSKYGYHPERFEKDVRQHQFESDLFRAKVRNLILEEPGKMDIRYHQAIEELQNIKNEFRL
jgi:hypothetical protein